MDYRSRVVALYQAYAPEKLSGVDATMEKYRNSESELIAALVKKYGPEPGAASPAPKQATSASPALKPTVAESAPPLVDTAQVDVEREGGGDSSQLRKIEAAVPAGGEIVAEAKVKSVEVVPAAREDVAELKRRILRMYEYYAPEKRSSADKLIEKYAGNEKSLLETLISKYGPEPAADATARFAEPLLMDEVSSRTAAVAVYYSGLLAIVIEMERKQRLIVKGSRVVEVERFARSAIIDEAALTTPAAPTLSLPFQSKEARHVVDRFFSALGVTSSEPCTIDGGTFGLLVDVLNVSAAPSPDEFPMTVDEFVRVITVCCDSESRMLESMQDFLTKLDAAVVADDQQNSRAVAQLTPKQRRIASLRSTPVDLSCGCWAHACVFPTIIERWSRVWVVLRDGVVQWTTANSKTAEGSIKLSQMREVRLQSMLANKAPRPCAKNGVTFRLSNDPNPIVVAICFDEMFHAQQMLKAVRELFRQLPPANRALETSPTPKEGSPVPPEKTSTVWCCRSGFQQFVKQEWAVSGSGIVYRGSEKEKRCIKSSVIAGVRYLPSSPPAPYPSDMRLRPHGFVIAFGDRSLLFCFCESSSIRQELVEQIKRLRFRHLLQSNSVKFGSNTSLESPDRGAPSSSPLPRTPK